MKKFSFSRDEIVSISSGLEARLCYLAEKAHLSWDTLTTDLKQHCKNEIELSVQILKKLDYCLTDYGDDYAFQYEYQLMKEEGLI